MSGAGIALGLLFLAGLWLPVLLGYVLFIILLILTWTKDKLDIFAPYVIFPIVWLLALSLTQLQLTQYEAKHPIRVEFYLLALFALFAFLIGSWLTLGKTLPITTIRKRLKSRWHLPKFLIALLFMTVTALIAMYYEYSRFNNLPIFSSDPDHLRVELNQAVSGWIHWMSMFPAQIIMVAAVYMFSKVGTLKLRNYIALGAFVVTNLALLSVWGARLSLVPPIVVVVVAFHYLRRRLGLVYIVVSLLLISLLLIVPLLVRQQITYQGYDYLYESSRANIPKSMAWTLPIYLGFSWNIYSANAAMEYVPRHKPYQMGAQMLLTPFWPLIAPLVNLIADYKLSRPPTYSAEFVSWHTTATYMTPLYVDFGVIGVLVGSLLLGMGVTMVYRRMRSSPTPFNVLLYSYIVFGILMSIYVNWFFITTFYVDLAILFFFNKFCLSRATQWLSLKHNSHPVVES